MTYKIKFENFPGFGALCPRVLLLVFMVANSFLASAQQPTYIAQANNTYKILQTANGSQSSGTAIVVGNRNDGIDTYNAQQEWYYDKSTSTIRLKANPNKCIARKNLEIVGDPIILADFAPNDPLQQWVLEDHKIKLLEFKELCISPSTDGNALTLDVLSNTGTDWIFREKASQKLAADGQLHRVNSPGDTYVEYAIPDPCPYKFLNINTRGGDGGYRSVKNIITGKEDIKARGGAGASTWGGFKIGTGAGELKPGTTIRFVIGRAGDSRKNDGGSKGCGGGGGTGVIYEAPGKKGGFYYPWEILLVAGGGGGAYSDCCAAISDGEPGSDSTNPGNGMTADETTDVGGGFRVNSDPEAVNLVQSAIDVIYYNDDRAGFSVIDGMVSPTGATSQSFGNTKTFGGFGFGAGGVAILDGGGGGGYSGGDAKKNLRGGYGGASYVNSGWTESGGSKKNGVTANSADGYVEYLFTNDGPVSRDLYFECHKGTEVQVLKSGDWTLLWQYDGNLVLYGPGFPNGAWASNTGGGDLFFQGDGNLVIYQANAGPWSTDTPDDHHNGKGGRKLVLTPDGSLFITDQDGKVLWKGR